MYLICEKSRISVILTVLLSILLFTADSMSQILQEDLEELKGIDVREHTGDTIPLNLTFTDDGGEQITLGKYFTEGRPVVLILGYYTCPMLCNLVMNGVADAVKQMDWLPGNEFQIVMVSIDPTETEVVATAKKKNYLKQIGKPGIEDGWVLLTGKEENSKEIADAIGFEYYYDEKRREYAHPAVIVVTNGAGMISRYFYGIQYNPRDLKFALMEASEGRVGSALDKVLLYCYHYDPNSGGYVAFAGNIMKLGGAITLIALGVLLGVLWVRERRKKADAVRDGVVSGGTG